MNTSETIDELPSLLLVDDDQVYCRVLGDALVKRGFDVSVAHDTSSGIGVARQIQPEYAIVDLNMPGESGLVLIKAIKALDLQTNILVLTGYASIATAVEAIKLGATHYLAKPVDADEIVSALNKVEGDEQYPVNQSPLSVNRLEWEHIQKVLAENDGNISATARALKMHRRTLQRKLSKKPMKE